MKALRVLIVDDHSIFRKGIRAALEGFKKIEVIGEVGNGIDAIQSAKVTSPDIILMDINMPGCDGLEATRKIKQLLPQTRIVILTVSDIDEDLYEAVKSGAQGYIQKDIDANELGKMLLRAAKGEALLSGYLAAKIMKEFRGDENTSEHPKENPLTKREVEVLNLVVTGCTNREIAEHLVISENTVKHHLTNILNKLHLKSRVQLAVYSVEQGIAKKSSEEH